MSRFAAALCASLLVGILQPPGAMANVSITCDMIDSVLPSPQSSVVAGQLDVHVTFNRWAANVPGDPNFALTPAETAEKLLSEVVMDIWDLPYGSAKVEVDPVAAQGSMDESGKRFVLHILFDIPSDALLQEVVVQVWLVKSSVRSRLQPAIQPPPYLLAEYRGLPAGEAQDAPPSFPPSCASPAVLKPITPETTEVGPPNWTQDLNNIGVEVVRKLAR